MALPKRVVLAVTGYYGPFYPDGKNTGIYFTEVLHPFEVFTKNGFEVVIASESGEQGLDDHSVVSPAVNEEELKLLKEKTHPVFKALEKTVKASALNPKDFSIFFAAGGHGTVFDFVKAPHLQKLAADIYEQGGVVSAVCHGPVILGDVKLSNGDQLLKGKRATGFTDAGEDAVNLTQLLREKGLVFVSEAITNAGGKYEVPKDPWTDYTVVDERVVTGVNPASATSVAERAIAVL